MFCSFCGNELADDAKFCPVCGTRVGDSAPSDIESVAAQTGQDVLLSGPRYPLGKPAEPQVPSAPAEYSAVPSPQTPQYEEAVSPPIVTGGTAPYSLSSIYDLPADKPAEGMPSAPAAQPYSPAPAATPVNSSVAAAPASAVPPVGSYAAVPPPAYQPGGYTGASSPAYPSQNPWTIPGMPPVQGGPAAKPKKKGKGKVVAIVCGCVAVVVATLVLLYFFLPPSIKLQFMGKGNYYLQLEMKNTAAASNGVIKLGSSTSKTQSHTTLLSHDIQSSFLTEEDRGMLSTVGFEGNLEQDSQTKVFNGDYTLTIGGQPLEVKVSSDGDKLGICIPMYSDKYYYVDLGNPSASADLTASLREATGLTEYQYTALTTKYAARLKDLLLRDDLMTYSSSDTCRGIACSSLSLKVDSKTLGSALSTILGEMEKDDLLIAALTNLSLAQQGKEAEIIPSNPSDFHPELRQSIVDGMDTLKTQMASREFADSFSFFEMKVYFTADDKIIGREYYLTAADKSPLLTSEFYLTEKAGTKCVDFTLNIQDTLEMSYTGDSSADHTTGSLTLNWYGSTAAEDGSVIINYDFTGMTADGFLPVGTLYVSLESSSVSFDITLDTAQGQFDSSYETKLTAKASFGGGTLDATLDFSTDVAPATSVTPDITDSNSLPMEKFQAGSFLSQFTGPSVDL